MLVVDDEELYRRALERILTRVGHNVLMARDATEAIGVVSSQPVDLVLCDIKMPGINGLELVRQIHEIEPDLPCIVITGYSSAENSIEALRAGAFWYLEKPFEQERLDVIRRLVDQAIEHGRLKAENRALHSQLRSRYKFDNIVGKSQALQEVLSVVEKVADTDSTVLITGESGTGKELIARALHYNSGRAARMMVTVNCGAIPEELLESELFGHVKGAFTNAVHQREGRFALADGGTIFLDEIGDMSPNLQVKLLRVLQERTFEPVGSSKTVKVDVRVIAATNQHLEELIEQKMFREDLFYRLNVLPIESPPLRHRADDIPLLVHHFIDIGNQEKNTQIDGISEEAMKMLMNFGWPGNVRELENMVERVMILRNNGEITAEDLPSQFHSQGAGSQGGSSASRNSVRNSVRNSARNSARNSVRNSTRDGNPIASERERTLRAPHVSADGISFNEVIGDLETDLILQALDQTHWNKNRAAQLLGLNRTTLLEKIKKKGLEPQTP